MRAARTAAITSREAFDQLDRAIPNDVRERWASQERLAMQGRAEDSAMMDIFQVSHNKGVYDKCMLQSPLNFAAPTIRSIELQLLSEVDNPAGVSHGRTTWLTRGLQIEELAISLQKDTKSLSARSTDMQKLAIARRADRLSADVSKLLSEASAYMKADSVDEVDPQYEDSDVDFDDDDDDDDDRPSRNSYIHLLALPLPSKFGRDTCDEMGIGNVADEELQLRSGQANDALHAIRLTLADKAVLFRTDVRHASNQAANTRAWGKVHSADAILSKHAAIYRKCRAAMVSLSANDEMLERYRPLKEADLRVSSAVLHPDGRAKRTENLAWFWTMDIPRDTEADDWMSECGDFNLHQ